MQPAGRKRFRAPLGDVSNSNALGFSLNHQVTLKLMHLTFACSYCKLAMFRRLSKCRLYRIENAEGENSERLHD